MPAAATCTPAITSSLPRWRCTFALFVLALTPSGLQNRALIELGAPLSAIARAEFFAANGVRIALAALLFAVGACVCAVVRRRMTPEQFA